MDSYTVPMETFSRETLDPWYVTGFAEGAATFTFSRSGRQLSLYFSLKLPTADRALLQSIQSFFGDAGKLYPTADGRSLYLRITRLPELVRVVEHFDTFPLQGARASTYATWREMVLIKQSSPRRPDRDRLNLLAAQLSSGR